jgi:hypothetical protein
MEVIMRLLTSRRTAFLAATAALLSASAQAGPMPTNIAAIKSMVDQNTTEVYWRGGYGYRSVGYRGGGWGYRGGYGYRGWGYRGLGYGAVAAGAIARRSYYGGYYGGGYPSYSYATIPYGYEGGYGDDSGYCPPDDEYGW